jgi:hypothetical protein
MVRMGGILPPRDAEQAHRRDAALAVLLRLGQQRLAEVAAGAAAVPEEA